MRAEAAEQERSETKKPLWITSMKYCFGLSMNYCVRVQRSMYVFLCVCVFCGSGEEGLKVMIWIEESLEKFSHTHKGADDERLLLFLSSAAVCT